MASHRVPPFIESSGSSTQPAQLLSLLRSLLPKSEAPTRIPSSSDPPSLSAPTSDESALHAVFALYGSSGNLHLLPQHLSSLVSECQRAALLYKLRSSLPPPPDSNLNTIDPPHFPSLTASQSVSSSYAIALHTRMSSLLPIPPPPPSPLPPSSPPSFPPSLQTFLDALQLLAQCDERALFSCAFLLLDVGGRNPAQRSGSKCDERRGERMLFDGVEAVLSRALSTTPGYWLPLEDHLAGRSDVVTSTYDNPSPSSVSSPSPLLTLLLSSSPATLLPQYLSHWLSESRSSLSSWLLVGGRFSGAGARHADAAGRVRRVLGVGPLREAAGKARDEIFRQEMRRREERGEEEDGDSCDEGIWERFVWDLFGWETENLER